MKGRVTRRDVLQAGGVGLAAMNLPKLAVEAAGQKRTPLPQLLKRGEPEVYSGDELKFIGMPVGGFFAGTVYLGGDGQLWNWDVFNRPNFGAVIRDPVTYMNSTFDAGNGANYVDPVKQQSPFHQRFDLVLMGAAPRKVRFGDIRFRGEYPIGKVTYSEADADVEMSLEAFSPFCPLDVDNSSFPATTLTFMVKNVGKERLDLRLQYETENPVLIHARKDRTDFNFAVEQTPNGGALFSVKRQIIEDKTGPDILFEDWSSGTYDHWVATGTAFGATPRKVLELPSYMGSVEAGTTYVANSHQTRNGEDVIAGDAHVGTLTSPAFTISRRYINLRVGGGAHKGGTCVNLTVDGKAVRSVTGHDNNAMRWVSVDVGDLLGKQARIEVIDNIRGAWGNISLGEVEFSDVPKTFVDLESLGDFGTFCVEMVGGANHHAVKADGGEVGQKFELAPGQSKEFTFVVAWHFPNVERNVPGKKRWYATRWKSASEAASAIVESWPELQAKTRTWNKTWYDSTLPFWFLDRTFVNLSTLATSTCHRLDEGRFYFWEGVGAGWGTCTHVWGYAHAMGRVFPEIERYLRKEIDFGRFINMQTGDIAYRAEYGHEVAVDGQASCILKTLREHQMSADDGFLRSVWPQCKMAMKRLMAQDPGADGILQGPQLNTLDTQWFGSIAWTSSLYIGALRAAEQMANLMDDPEFARDCAARAEKGSGKMVKELFNGQYFINTRDPAHAESNNTLTGCHIDQLYGQSWALQVGLPRVVPKDKAVTALKSLFRLNFYDDVWEYRRKNTAILSGRWYALPKEAGLIMTSFPNGDAAASAGTGANRDSWAVGYFNECMTGFEHQAAHHMISEGLLNEGLQVLHAIHLRYHAAKRNPYNEIEYSDHYGRAMASYGAFVSITGFRIDGPKHQMAFAPKVGGDFKCAFINEQGWGSYHRSGGKETVEYRCRNGKLA